LKAWVKASTWIPIFEADDNFDAGTVTRKVTNFVMGISQFLLSYISVFVDYIFVKLMR
jgi:hypothetical protein